jgi:hypothetical protein
MFTFYSQPEWAEPKPKAFVVGTRGGAVLLSPATGTCVTSASVTVRFVCGSTQLEEVGTSDASGVTVQAPDFTEPGDYSVLVALNGKQVAARLKTKPKPMNISNLNSFSVRRIRPSCQRYCWQEKVAEYPRRLLERNSTSVLNFAILQRQ